MRLPISWLKEYVDFDDTPQGLAAKLTFSGTEVEGIETIGSTYEGLVVGEVLAVDKHPNADKLTLCRVHTGSDEMTVVCGAPNVRPGIQVPFARVGVTLPNGMKLKSAKIRGVVSEGMLCAEDELNISEDHSGLMILDGKWAPGTPLSEVLGPPETVLELEVTPNRPDCLSVLGMAREVAALYGMSVKWPDVQTAESNTPVEQLTSVKVEDEAGCPRYTARIISGVRIGPSPAWMKRRLELSGIRAINNVVDITNYVMLECGQPLHAFDQSLLEEGIIIVRRARAGEKMATLDGIDRPLTPNMLVIADGRRPVAVAGVMGGAGSEIRDVTRNVLLESAFFKPQDIRATAKKLGMMTESSYRFERGADIGRIEWASRRAAALMMDFAGGTPARGVIDVYARPRCERKVVCRFDRVRSLLGVDASNDQIQKVFQSLLLPVAESNNTVCAVQIPSFRVDLDREVDLIEEFARIYGLEKIPLRPPRAALAPGADDKPVRAAIACRQHLVGLGLRETMNYSFVSEQLLNRFDASDTSRRVVLPHPVNLEESTLRSSLIPQLVESMGRNLARQLATVSLFEMGRVFRLNDQDQPTEEERLAIGLMGPVGRSGLDRQKPVQAEEMFLWIKGIWENLGKALNLKHTSLREISVPYLEERQALALLVDGESVGLLGLLKAGIRREWRMTGPTAVLEARLTPILMRIFEGKSFAPIAVYPSISRDAALVVERSVQHEDILKIIEKVAPKELEKVELFDIFSGEGISTGKKSMAYSFTYRSLMRTLTDEDANRYHEWVKDALKKELGLEVREG
jgi:phenylalanyl-tRNA synthetase beta chain